LLIFPGHSRQLFFFARGSWNLSVRL